MEQISNDTAAIELLKQQAALTGSELQFVDVVSAKLVLGRKLTGAETERLVQLYLRIKATNKETQA